MKVKGGEGMNNGAAHIFQQLQSSPKLMNPSKNSQLSNEARPFLFQQILGKHHASDDTLTKQAFAKGEAPQQVMGELPLMITAKQWEDIQSESSKQVNKNLTLEMESASEQVEWMGHVNGSSEKWKHIQSDNVFMQLFAEVKEILGSLTTIQETSKVAPKVLQLLQKWTNEVNKNGAHISKDQIPLLSKTNSKEAAIWQNFVQAFAKRNQLVQKQQYNSDAKVTVQDVAKWLSNTLEQQGMKDTVGGLAYSSTVPSAKIEQHAIYINPTQQSSNSTGKQFMEQFQHIIKSSRFMAMPNGTNQLNISIRPQNLGEMIIRLTQVEGEMTVRILVSSQATKDMLESNMQQLRHMFSPQQVVVEKQDFQSQQPSQHMQKQPDTNSEQYSDQDQPKENLEQEQQEHPFNDDFDTQLKELLINEQA